MVFCSFVVPDPKATAKPPQGQVRCQSRARKSTGLPEVRLHDLRHNWAFNMVNASANAAGPD